MLASHSIKISLLLQRRWWCNQQQNHYSLPCKILSCTWIILYMMKLLEKEVTTWCNTRWHKLVCSKKNPFLGQKNPKLIAFLKCPKNLSWHKSKCDSVHTDMWNILAFFSLFFSLGWKLSKSYGIPFIETTYLQDEVKLGTLTLFEWGHLVAILKLKKLLDLKTKRLWF